MSVLGQPPSYQDTQLLSQIAITPVAVTSELQDKSMPALITVTQGSEVDPVTEEFKQAIYRHPLFPLMAMVFEKCETVCASLDALDDADVDADIESFVQHGQQTKQALLTDNTELDNLMLKAIQVLRIHLLELAKVRELCKDFCQRYIVCLKGKLQSEHLLRLDDLDSPPLSPTSCQMATDWTGSGAVGFLSSPVGGGLGGVLSQPNIAMATISQGQIISGNIVYQMVHTPQGLVAQPIQIQPSLQTAVGTSSIIQGTNPLSQLGVVGSPVTAQSNPVTPLNLCVDDSGGDDDDPLGKRRSTKRGVLPKQATQIMKTWLFQHLVHPYPTEDEKRTIASQTNLTLLQVNNWFINARRRILQPMLDSGEKAKKPKPATRPLQRFWPESIANITPQLPPDLHHPDYQPSSPASDLSTSPTMHTTTTSFVNAVAASNSKLMKSCSPSSSPISLVITDSNPITAAMDNLKPQNFVLTFSTEGSAD